MRTLAKKAGVSASTISLVLRNHPSISESTRRKVLAAQVELGYSLNRLRPRRKEFGPDSARALVYRLVGIPLREETYAPFLHGVMAECARRKVKLSVDCVPRHGVVSGREEQLASAGDGLIVAGDIDDAEVAKLVSQGTRFVVLGNHRLTQTVNTAEVDLFQAATDMVEALLAKGHRHFGLVVEMKGRPYEATMLQYLLGILAFRGVTMDPRLIFETGPGFVQVGRAVDRVLSVKPRRTAMIATEVFCGERCVTELISRGVTVPGEMDFVSVINGGRVPHNPRLPVYDLGAERLGALAVSRLLQVNEQPEELPMRGVLAPVGWLNRVV